METMASRNLPRVARAVPGTRRSDHRRWRFVRHGIKACNFFLKMELHIRGIHLWYCKKNNWSAIPPRIRGIRHDRYNTYYRQNFPESCHVIRLMFFYLRFLCLQCFFGLQCRSIIEATDRIIDTGRTVVNIEKIGFLSHFIALWGFNVSPWRSGFGTKKGCHISAVNRSSWGSAPCTASVSNS